MKKLFFVIGFILYALLGCTNQRDKNAGIRPREGESADSVSSVSMEHRTDHVSTQTGDTSVHVRIDSSGIETTIKKK